MLLHIVFLFLPSPALALVAIASLKIGNPIARAMRPAVTWPAAPEGTQKLT